MRRALGIGAFATLALAASPAGWPQTPPGPAGDPQWAQTVDDTENCLIESHDPILNDEILGLLAPFAAQLGAPPAPPALPIGPGSAPAPHAPNPPGRLLLRLEGPDPAGPPRAPVLTVTRHGLRFDFQVTGYLGPSFSIEEWLREVTCALIYRRAAAEGAGPVFSKAGALPPLPLWLAEGAFETVVSEHPESYRHLDQAETFNQIARRARSLGTLPTAQTVAGWQELSSDPIFRAWQETFCWQLYLFYRDDPARAKRLDHWYQADAGLPDPDLAEADLEASWKSHQQSEGTDPLYSWDQTVSLLAALQTTLVPGDAKHPPLVLKWAELPQAQAPGYPAFRSVIQQKISQLILLEMRANFAWRPVIALYRDALQSLQSPSPSKQAAPFPARLAVADAAAARLTDLNQRVEDYLNWFEVTRRAGGGTAFKAYFDLNGEFESLEQKARAPLPVPLN